jgi:hypothetical protein
MRGAEIREFGFLVPSNVREISAELPAENYGDTV